MNLLYNFLCYGQGQIDIFALNSILFVMENTDATEKST